MPRTALRHPRSWIAPISTGCVYFAVASLALSMSRFEGGLAFIWAANAFLMAELLTSRTAHWTRTIIACGIASAAATAWVGMGAIAALPMAAINILESLIVVVICRWFVADRLVTGAIRPLVVFVIALCGAANILAGLGAAWVASTLTPVSFAHAFVQWYTGHVLGGLICAPILIMAFQGEFRRWLDEASMQARVEAVLLLALFALTTFHVFHWARYPLLFAPLLPLVLIAFRVGHMGSALAIILLAAIGGQATMAGIGPLAWVADGTGERIQFFQFYLALSFLLCMPVAVELAARKRLFQMLQQSEARYRAMAEYSGDVVLNIGVDGVIQYASPSATEQIGCAPDLLVGQEAANLVDPQDRDVVIAAYRRALAQPGSVHKVEFRPLVMADGLEWCEMVSRAMIDERGLPSGVVSMIRDMSRHKARQHALQQVAARDSLTGADSRRAFLEKLDREIARAAMGARSSLFLIDIDHFKSVNDRFGHGAGDRVLSAFVERLRLGLRTGDSIGRLGGEEFAILLANSDIDRSSMMCERLRALLVDPILVEASVAITITFSAGLVELDGASDRSAMLEAADKALYRAKHSGRNCLRLAA
ncbi:sensor domain-containing diguanylate cyclase [Sphingobium limneticum]|uniref:diguanylate cyclase n=1 Tax=Sphingobium limneticum TaxID=1007511 RepID=A0A5J5I6X9_9SPHN|nr:diguanylate cyclase [Sphingobium limneticum]KAA9018862.1 diguanylate cyclase [Sphingobium limneticum]KAA9031436.1 diguanylate cyclase [Sphingobium limneticum]